MNLSEFLVFLRSELEFESAKSFHADLVKRGLDCNYPTYKKIENGQLVPSPALVTQLSEAVPASWKDEVILAYSRTQFPRHAYLFPAQIAANGGSPAKPKSSVNTGARELTKRQVSILARSMQHYYFFVLLTLARRPLTRKELDKQFKKDFEKVRKDFEDGEFLKPEESGIAMHTTEWKFPPSSDDPSLVKIYRQFDEWDSQFSERFDFETLVQKIMMRRVSPRYISLIQKQLEICMDLIKTSDELDSRYNESLLMIRVQLKSGSAPG